MNRKTNSLQIRTPEGIVFSVPLAGPVVRSLAWVVDLACIAVATGIAGTVAGALGAISLDLAGAVSMVIYFTVSIGYGIATEWLLRGQTIGKRLLHLRVIDSRGLKLQFSQVAIRNLLRFFDSLPIFYLVGGAACFINGKYQRLGDFAANTVVIRDSEAADPDVDKLVAGKFNSLRGYPHLTARLRQQTTPQEAAIALQALMRRDEFAPDARIELFREIAGHFRSIVEFPEEAVYGIADEQYIRNVVDILFRENKPAGL